MNFLNRKLITFFGQFIYLSFIHLKKNWGLAGNIRLHFPEVLSV